MNYVINYYRKHNIFPSITRTVDHDHHHIRHHYIHMKNHEKKLIFIFPTLNVKNLNFIHSKHFVYPIFFSEKYFSLFLFPKRKIK
ncbi:hypothetical protein [Blattabacterium cuenoti]|uniref:hypothetical protein n=1 Tax=Blattabacterium cuenoti TaxID=1653831 RepID=UPI001EEB9D05|nr:hypothetical protein [Blattabacterium cuenoti]